MQLAARCVQGAEVEYMRQQAESVLDALYDLRKLLQQNDKKLWDVLKASNLVDGVGASPSTSD